MKTKDYSKFGFFATNRPVIQHKVESFKEEFGRIGYIEELPILVNKKFQILDGQHRFHACKELGLPIIYAIHSNGNADEDLMISLNTHQSTWRLNEYIHHFAERGVKYHAEVRDFEEKHHLGMSNSISICGKISNGKMLKEIKAGENLPLNPKREEIADFIHGCNELHFYKTSYFVRAVIHLFELAKKEDIQKLQKRFMSIPHAPSMGAYIVIFENIINKPRLECCTALTHNFPLFKGLQIYYFSPFFASLNLKHVLQLASLNGCP